MDRKRKIIIWILTAWALCILGILGITFMLKSRLKEQEVARVSIVDRMVDDISNQSQHTFVVKANELPVEGEEEDIYQEPVDTEPVESSTEDEPAEQDSNSSGDYTLTSYGTISIPSIDCELPIWVGAGTVELRYGVGWVPISSHAGQQGNFVVLGHRMRKYGSIFNRLGEVQIGDTITVTAEDSNFVYVVDQIEVISPSELSSYIGIADDRCRITLVTCTPTGVGSHRLLVIGHIV